MKALIEQMSNTLRVCLRFAVALRQKVSVSKTLIFFSKNVNNQKTRVLKEQTTQEYSWKHPLSIGGSMLIPILIKFSIEVQVSDYTALINYLQDSISKDEAMSFCTSILKRMVVKIEKNSLICFDGICAYKLLNLLIV